MGKMDEKIQNADKGIATHKKSHGYSITDKT